MLESLNSKLVKSRHTLHATNLQCEHGRAECDKSRSDVEANDAAIGQLEEQERRLKMQYIEAKLAFKKMHATNTDRRSSSRRARRRLRSARRASRWPASTTLMRCDWTKAHEEHVKAEETAKMLSAKLEAVEKDKENQRRRAQSRHGNELGRFSQMHEQMKRELDVILASASAVGR